MATTYKKPCALLVTCDGDLPRFGELEDILCSKGEVYFHLQLRETLYFSSHYHCYILGKKEEMVTMHVGCLLSHVPLHVRRVKELTHNGQRVVVLKHHISSL